MAEDEIDPDAVLEMAKSLPRDQLGGLAGTLIARAMGGNAKVGRVLGKMAAQLTKPEGRAKLNGWLASLRRKR